ncbi:fimbria/pilus periplasmic chaperone [Vulcaniibacterium tengchongense]|uniref:Chaperone protein EcpD n=1 Tax=Vulcaniibacterium tengchongense TaxID=1273429 RepID=A0A3N4W665_9GAMM|nr:fimbria/pilus periplasmic chaperone [Vulcaniibacterium tengchongense]RPE81580.1 chaperone protein EcpD [Vulcaniibacterium tengchongense]
MNAFVRIGWCAVLAASAALAAPAQAGVIIHGTRVVYPSNEREVTVRLENKGKDPVLVQTWIDAGDASVAPEKANVPFNLAPPIFRLDPDKSQSVRLMHTGQPLPQDRETLFWFNALEVPPKSQDGNSNLLQFSFRTRIKLFYRPAALDGEAVRQAPDKLVWSLTENPSGAGLALKADNPTPYHVNFANVALDVGGRKYEHDGGGMVAPMSSAVFPLNGLATRPAGAKVEFDVITDLGATDPRSIALTP